VALRNDEECPVDREQRAASWWLEESLGAIDRRDAVVDQILVGS
jgi:hypothetical protein